MAGGDLPAALVRRVRSAGRVGVAAGLVAMAVIVASDLNPLVNAANDPYVVNSPADLSLNDDPTLCDTSPTCTLRAAIQRANSESGHDRIEFAIPGAGPHTIAPATRFPLLNDQDGVTIDGYTQPGSSVNTLDHGTNADIRIELQGPGPASNVEGFYIRSSNNVIRGLALFDFDKHIRIYGDDPTTPSDDIVGTVGYNEIVGNFIGTNAAGTHQESVLVQNSDGVHLQHGTISNRIGKPGNAHRNVISGVADRGIGLYNPGTNFNLIQNNIVGLAPGADGLTPLGNINHGIDINLGASYNTVGGWNAGDGNVSSANGRSGVEVSHNPGGGVTESNLVIGNLIGTSADGTRALDVTANEGYGIFFEGSELCLSSCPADIARNVAAANVVVGSRSNIVLSKGATENVVTGNWIGMLVDGSKPESAARVTQQGVSIEAGAFGNRIEHNEIAYAERGIHSTPPDSNCPKLTEPNGPECRAGEFPVFHNTFSQNAIRNVTLLGIELREKGGAGYLDGPGVGPEVNDGIVAPIIVSSGADAVTTDRVVITTCSNCLVEVFAEVAPVGTCCWLGNGLGGRYLFTATADGSGRVERTLRTVPSDELVIEEGSEVSATATDADGNTSEVSLRATVGAGSVGSPSSPTTTVGTTTSTTVTIVSPTTTVVTTQVAGQAEASQLASRCTVAANC